jgi:YggT family protein
LKLAGGDSASACSGNRQPLNVEHQASYALAALVDFEPMRALLDVILVLLDMYIWLLIAAAVLSWLIAFNVVNVRNPFVGMVGDFLYRITEPVLRPIRNMMPNLGGLDISPVILILIIYFIQNVIRYYIYPNVF